MPDFYWQLWFLLFVKHKSFYIKNNYKAASYLKSGENFPLGLQNSDVVQHPGKFKPILCVVNHLRRCSKNTNLNSKVPIKKKLKMHLSWPQYTIHNQWFCYICVLRPASLTFKKLQRRKIIHSMRSVGRKDRSIDLNMCVCRNIPFA